MLSKPPKLGISDSVAKVVSAAMHKEAGLTFGVPPQPGTAPFENDEPPAWVSKLAKAAAKGLPAPKTLPKTFPKPDWTLGRLAVLPLLRKTLAGVDLSSKAKEIASVLREAGIDAIVVEDGLIGRRYKEQDEAGTRACLTVDGGTIKNQTVTVREYGKIKQYRARIKSVIKKFKAHP